MLLKGPKYLLAFKMPAPTAAGFPAERKVSSLVHYIKRKFSPLVFFFSCLAIPQFLQWVSAVFNLFPLPPSSLSHYSPSSQQAPPSIMTSGYEWPTEFNGGFWLKPGWEVIYWARASCQRLHHWRKWWPPSLTSSSPPGKGVTYIGFRMGDKMWDWTNVFLNYHTFSSSEFSDCTFKFTLKQSGELSS